MSFLAPLFLAGLAAVAVPVILHLLRRESRDVITFPSLMFLRKIPYQSVRRQRVRHWTLLALRCLAVLLVASAFARPFLGDVHAIGSATGARELVILVDRSYSMGYADRWRRATTAARDAVAGLGPDDHATLVLFDEHPEAVAAGAEPASLGAAVDAARPGDGATKFGPALALAGRLLDASERPRREVVLISDFQRRGWDRTDTPRLPAGTGFDHVDVAADETRNTLVRGVEFRRQMIGGREHVTTAARVANAGEEALRGVRVSIEINGREMETTSIDLPARGMASVNFKPLALREGVTRGSVRLVGDALPADDAWHFALAGGQILVIRIVQRPGASARETLYLRRALSIGDQPPTRVEVSSGAPAAAELEDADLVILNGVGWPEGDAGRRLDAFVRRGGGVVMIAGASSTGARATAPLPGLVGEVVDRIERFGGTLGVIDRQHPVFAPFGDLRSGALSSARIFRYRQVTPADSARVIARFDDGAPALIERAAGEGRVMLWASMLDNAWSDLPVQPVFLPLVHRLALHASGFADMKPWSMVGETIDAAAASEAGRTGDDDLVVSTPSGRTVRPDRSRASLTLDEQGFYEIRTRGVGGGAAHVVAANAERGESDLTRFDPAELALAVAPAADEQGETAGRGPLTAEVRERRAALWWYLLLAAALVFAAEAVVANRLAHRMREV